jgi:hypothetical protein
VGLGGHGHVAVGFEAVDIGVEQLLLELEVDVAFGIEGENGVVLDDETRRRGEALDVEDDEADALARELGHRGIGLTAPEAVQTICTEGTDPVIDVEVERVPSIEFD